MTGRWTSKDPIRFSGGDTNLYGYTKAGGYRFISRASQYSYDNVDRLTGSTEPLEAFAYDAVGNRQWSAQTNYNVLNQLITDGSKYSYEYSMNGELTRKTDLETGEVMELTWSAESELARVQRKSSSGVLLKDVRYKYDGLGRRIEKQVIDPLDAAKSYTRRFRYDGPNVLEDQDGNNVQVASYLNGPGIDEPILMDRVQGTFVYTKDGQGSVRELTKLTGELVQRYRYSAFGIMTQELDETLQRERFVENRYGFTGREIEEETGLQYNRARYYDPVVGRWVSRDPVGFMAGDLNLYGYIWNDPVNAIDPNGTDGIIISVGGAAALSKYPSPVATHGYARESVVGSCSWYGRQWNCSCRDCFCWEWRPHGRFWGRFWA